jgi:trehalose 6-phosphate phosphatase
MKFLLGEIGRQRLQALTHARSLYAFDFDGTLTHIARDRHAVRLSRRVRTQLHELSRHAPIAIISGRSLQDLRTRVGRGVPYLIGNHGVEGSHELAEVRNHAQQVCAAWKGQVGARWHHIFRRLGVEVEDKAYSLTFHYRAATRKRAAREAVIDALSELRPSPRIVLGKLCVNALPPGTPNKGGALLKLMARLRVQRALFVGDDATDEDVFSLLDSRIVTGRIGVKKNSDAQFFLKRQSEIGDLLHVLLAAHNGASMPGRSKRGTAGRSESGAA